MDLGVASKVWTLRSWKNKETNSGVTLSANHIFEVRFFGCNFLCWNRGCWMVGFRRKIRIANVEIVNLHQLVLLTHLCKTEQAQGKTSWDAGLMPKTMISPMTYKLTKWTNELPQYVSELTSVPSLPIIQGCPNGVDTLTPQLPGALQRTLGRQKIPWKSRPQILNSFWKSVKFIL